MSQRVDIKYWLIGLAMFALLITAGALFQGDAVYTIIDHQAAASAARANQIQMDWENAGIREIVIASMIGDLAFIVVYSIGAWRAGQSLLPISGRLCRAIGVILLASAALFFATDIIETSLQLIQMLLNQGVNWMAATAAFAQPIKIAAFVISFFGVLAGLIAQRFA